MPGRRIALPLAIASLLAANIWLVACASHSEPAPSEQLAESAPAVSDAQPTDSTSTDEDWEAEKERLGKLEAAYQKTLETKDAWADSVVVDALNALAAEGAIAPLPDDYSLFDKAFEFEPSDEGYDIAYLNGEAKRRLSDAFALDLAKGEKVALCHRMAKRDAQGERLSDLEVLYTKKDGAFSTAVKKHDEDLLATPTLMPGGESKLGSALDPSIPKEAFADSPDDCRYLIAYGGCPSHVEKDYYSTTPGAKATADRVDTTTLVLIVDARERKVLHIENIGTDVPADSVDAAKSEAVGKVLDEEARAYISKLLLG